MNKLFVLALAVGSLGAASAVEARTTPIDIGTDEVLGDADDGSVISLLAPVNYGAGSQSSVTVHFGAEYSSNGLNLDPVSLSFANGDSVYATLMAPLPGTNVVIISNPGEDTSTPNHVINPGSIFDFGPMYDVNPDTQTVLPNMGGIYGPFDGSASFQFIDLSASGSPGDFELLLSCKEMCTNIGFDLGGSSFSATSSAPPPSQLVSSNVSETPAPFIANGSWDFVFRNVSAVPEPSSWMFMLLGFALIGAAVRRRPTNCLT